MKFRHVIVLAAAIATLPIVFSAQTQIGAPATATQPVTSFNTSAVNGGGVVTSTQLLVPVGAVGAPGITSTNALTRGIYFPDTVSIGFAITGTEAFEINSTAVTITNGFSLAFSAGSAGTQDTRLTRNGVGYLGTTALLTAGTDSTLVTAGDLTRQRNSYTITPATGGAGNCGTAFAAAALTADCTIATLPAGMKLVSIYADVTAGFTCSGTCTGTKVVQAGTAAGGTQVLAAALNVAATGQFGLADADLGSGMTRAAAIQGGLVGSWSATTPISARFTSGTGNWGNGAATFVNAGSIKFILVTEQIK